MAISYLTGNPNTFAAGSWSDGVGFASAATLVIPDGNNSIVNALDQSAVTHSLYLRVMRLFSGNIGSSTAPLNCSISDGSGAQKTSANTEGFFQYLASGGNCYIKAAGTTAGTNSIDNVFQNSSGKLFLVANLFPRVHLESGPLDVNTNVISNYFEAYGGSSTWDVEATVTGFTQVDIWGGNHTIKRALIDTTGVLNLFSGVTTIDYETASAHGFPIVNLYPGATLIHKAGDITTLNHFPGGVHDATQIRRACTVGTCIRRPGSIFRGRRVGDLLTVTTDTNIGFITL